MLRKKTLVRRDKEVNDSVKKGKRRVDKIIFNNGKREELKVAADEIYENIITKEEKTKLSVREKYKVRNIPQKVISKSKKT